MFTPQQKGPSRWSLSPRIRDTVENGSGLKQSGASGGVFGKGKGKNVVDGPPPPPRVSLGVGGFKDGTESAEEDPEVWKKFCEAGMLDESALQTKNREALVQRTSELEKELYEYQYNMGILLLEKKDWTSNFNEVGQALAEAEETLKREQSAHLIAISEFEKREENFRNALGVEKQCVADLEKALREMRSEIAEVKFTSEKKFNEARALEAGLEEKYLEVEEKLHIADANLAEASRKSSEMNRKLDDLEDRERKLQKEYQSFNSERKMHEKDISEQRDHLLDWEKRLQDNHKRMLERQQVLNEREDHANELEKVLRKKEFEIEEAAKRVEAMKVSLKNKEEEIAERLNSLAVKEKKSDSKIESLEKKEKELIAREEDLDARERVEIGQLLEEHNARLHSKEREFDLDLEKKSKVFNEKLQAKLDEVERKKKEIDLQEAQILNREKTLQDDLQNLGNKERDLDIKSKALRNWEDSLKAFEDELNKEKQQLGREKEELLKSRAELENLSATTEALREQILNEEQSLKLTREEREEHSQLQSKLKQETEEYMTMKDSLYRDKDDLKQERKKFEEEWELLDERKSELDSQIKKFSNEREIFEKWRTNEEQRLKNEILEARINIERELEEVRLKREAFEKTTEHEKMEAIELLKRERADMEREIELRRHELEMDMQRKQEAMEKKLADRENEFQRRREMELDQMKSLNNQNESTTLKLKKEQDQLAREKEDLSTHRKNLEAEQLDIQKDISSLSMLSRNLKDQREEFVKEKEHFLALAKQYKTCKNCGQPAGDLELASLMDAGNMPHLMFEANMKIKNTEKSPVSRIEDSTSPGGRFLRLCSGILKFSPRKKTEDPPRGQTALSAKMGKVVEGEASHGSGIREYEDFRRSLEATESSFGVTNNSVDVLIQTESGLRKSEGELNMTSLDQNEREISSIPLQDDSQPESSKKGHRQASKTNRPKSVKRTRTMKAVVEEAKVLLGDSSNEKNDGHSNVNVQEDSQGHSIKGDIMAVGVGQKRRLAQTSGLAASELDDENSEARSESTSHGARRKRRQVSISGAQEKRYNLRSSTFAGTSAGQALTDQARGSKVGDIKKLTGNQVPEGGGETEEAANPDAELPALEVGIGSLRASQILQQRTVESVTEVFDISSQRVTRIGELHAQEIGELHAQAESNNDMVVRSVEQSEHSGGYVVDGAMAEGTGPATPTREYSEDDEDEDDEMEKHNASIGKKIWTFFTT